MCLVPVTRPLRGESGCVLCPALRTSGCCSVRCRASVGGVQRASRENVSVIVCMCWHDPETGGGRGNKNSVVLHQPCRSAQGPTPPPRKTHFTRQAQALPATPLQLPW